MGGMIEISRKLARIVRLNRVIWLLTVSDVFSWGFYGSINALIGIYLSAKLGMEAVEVVGIGFGIFYFVRSISAVPIGLVTDKIKRDRDDIIILTVGNLIMGVVFLFYPVIMSPGIFYLLQGIFGIGVAMNLVTWRKLFARNLDKGREGFSYALYDTIMSASIALFSLIVGFIAGINQDFFDGVIMFIGVVIMLSSILPALIFDVKTRKSV